MPVAPAGPTLADECSYVVGQPAQEMRMPREVEEETGLEYLPHVRYLIYFPAAARVFSAGWVGPTVAHIQIPQAFDGNGLFRHGLRQRVGILVGRLPAAGRQRRPILPDPQKHQNIAVPVP